jgi:hypothetical protein
MKILLVEPSFPISPKSKNHSNFLPIGLLKIAAYHRSLRDKIELKRGNYPATFYPDQIKITSLFTYWSKYVKESVDYYRKLYPKAFIEVGGIYASLIPEHCKAYTGCDKVSTGLYRCGIAEKFDSAYDLVKVDYQIVHASRGCFRHCHFCGTWKIEPKVTYKKTLKDEIKMNRLVFYDNNLISNPHIENILNEISEIRVNRSVVNCESQSGLDGRILEKKPFLANLLKKARFQNPRIAWDGGISLKGKIKNQIDILLQAGYQSKDTYIFMLYNHQNVPYDEMREKLEQCRKWRVQVIDCRFRPLDRTIDNYNPRAKKQISEDYYISPCWTDWQVRRFRKAVRRQNIAIRLELPKGRYVEGIEKRFISIKE